MNAAEVLASVREAGAWLYLSPEGRPKVRGGDLLSSALREEARACLLELAAVLQVEAEAVRAELAAWLGAYEEWSRWLAADPARLTVDGGNVAAVLAGVRERAARLAYLAPADAGLEDLRRAARERLEEALTRWEAGCRWFEDDPARADVSEHVELLGGVGAAVLEGLELLEALSPKDPALEDGRRRLDAEGAKIYPNIS